MPEQAGLTDAALHVGEPGERITRLGRGSREEAGSRTLLDFLPSPHPIHPLSSRSSPSCSSPPVQHPEEAQYVLPVEERCLTGCVRYQHRAEMGGELPSVLIALGSSWDLSEVSTCVVPLYGVVTWE